MRRVGYIYHVEVSELGRRCGSLSGSSCRRVHLGQGDDPIKDWNITALVLTPEHPSRSALHRISVPAQPASAPGIDRHVSKHCMSSIRSFERSYQGRATGQGYIPNVSICPTKSSCAVAGRVPASRAVGQQRPRLDRALR